MTFEEKLAEIWGDSRSRGLIFIFFIGAYYGMLALGYLIIVGILFGTAALIYAIAGLAIIVGLYLLARLFRDRIRAMWNTLLRHP